MEELIGKTLTLMEVGEVLLRQMGVYGQCESFILARRELNDIAFRIGPTLTPYWEMDLGLDTTWQDAYKDATEMLAECQDPDYYSEVFKIRELILEGLLWHNTFPWEK